MKIIFSQSSSYKYVKLIDNPYYRDPTGGIARQNNFEKLREMVINLAPDFFKNSAESYRQINEVFPQRKAYDLTPEKVEDFLNRLMEHLENKKYSDEISETEEGIFEFPVEKTVSQEELEQKVREIGKFIVQHNPQVFEDSKAWALRAETLGKEIPAYLPFNDQLAIVRVESIENQGLNFRGDITSIYNPIEDRMVLLTEDVEKFDPSYESIRSFGGRFPMDAEAVKRAEDALKNTGVAYQ
jgi:uncharacterized protein YdhG (YjbR/CyaY superfamily)